MLICGFGPETFYPQHHGAKIRRDQAGKHAQQGGFTRAGLPQNADDLVVVKAQIDFIQHQTFFFTGRLNALLTLLTVSSVVFTIMIRLHPIKNMSMEKGR